jgi:hypothetical protein
MKINISKNLRTVFITTMLLLLGLFFVVNNLSTQSKLPEIKECKKLNLNTGKFDYGTGYVCDNDSECNVIRSNSQFPNQKLRCEKSRFVRHDNLFINLESGISCGYWMGYYSRLGFSEKAVFCPKGPNDVFTYFVLGLQEVSNRLNKSIVQYKNPDECQSINYVDEKEWCLHSTADKNPGFKDVTFCDQFSFFHYRDNCILDFAETYKDPSVCEKISSTSPHIRESCDSTILTPEERWVIQEQLSKEYREQVEQEWLKRQ